MNCGRMKPLFVVCLLLLMISIGKGGDQDTSNIESLPISDEYHSRLFNLKYLLQIPDENTASGFHGMTLSADSRYVATANKDNGLLIIDLDDFSGQSRQFKGETVQAVEFFPNHPALLACGTNKALHILRGPEFKIGCTLEDCHDDGGTAWIFIHPSNTVFGISPSSPMERTTRLYEWRFSESEKGNLPSFKFIGKKETEIVNGVFSISPDGQWLGHTMRPGSTYGLAVYKLEVQGFPEMRPHSQFKTFLGKTEKSGLVFVAGFSPDGSLCVGGGNASVNVITIWDLKNGPVIDEIAVPMRKGGESALSMVTEMIYGLKFSKDGARMAATWSNYIGIWEKKDTP